MSYLTKEQALGGIVKGDVEAFGGTVQVSELPADIVSEWLESGFINASTGHIDIAKINILEVAARVLLQPKMTVAEIKQASGGGALKCVMKAIEITDWGQGDDSKN
jgi:hypothetical protein